MTGATLLDPATASLIMFGAFFLLLALRVPVAFAMVFLWWGIDFTRFAFNRISELAELPLWVIHVAWPLAGATWILFQGEHAWSDLRVLARGGR
ncbi:MAG TPA: TRAP transporter small permease subunit [Burkholderiales bacterium]